MAALNSRMIPWCCTLCVTSGYTRSEVPAVRGTRVKTIAWVSKKWNDTHPNA